MQRVLRKEGAEPEQIPAHARLVVIGGGVAGASALYHLARMGWTESILVERNELTSGSTWHAAGNCPNFATTESVMRLQRYSNRLYARLGPEVGYPVDFHVTGAVRLAQSRERMDEFRHLTGVARRLGIEFEMLGVQAARVRFPFAEFDGVHGAQWDPDDGDIDPAQLTQAFAKGARDLGARIVRFCNVTAICRIPGGVWRIETSLGPVTAEVIVNAAGYRAAEVGAMLGRALPCVPIAHQYMVTEPIAALTERGRKLPLLRDPDDGWYLRQEGQGFLLGIYGTEPRAPWEQGVPAEFAFALFSDDLEQAPAQLERAVRRVPLLQSAGVRRIINGPIPYTPDGNPLIGPAPGLRNVFECCVFSFGIAQAGGAGKALAEWVVEGETEWDSWAVDPRRFTGHVTREKALASAREIYRNEYAIAYPAPPELSAGPARKSALYPQLQALDAAFVERNGWGWATRFERGGERHQPPGFGWPDWFDTVAEECAAVTRAAGLIELPGSSRFEIGGRGAARWLDGLLASRLPEAGHVAPGLCCSDRGSPLCLFTVARFEDTRFWLIGSPESEWHDRDWLERHLPTDGSATFEDLTHGWDRLLIAGPRSHDLIPALSTAGEWAHGTSRWLEIGPGQLAWLGTGAYGEAGFELHIPNPSALDIYDRLIAEGEAAGLKNFGLEALESLRLEMGEPEWKKEALAGLSAIECGLGRLIDFEKQDFIGRAALACEAAKRPRRCLGALTVEMGSAPPFAGSSIFRADQRIGHVTSGGFGHRICSAIALGILHPDCAAPGIRLEVEVLGERRTAEVVQVPLSRGGVPQLMCSCQVRET
ncbi:MAG: FAD-dependent oxidoreductase [Acetobacteraceae bacterium]